MTDRELEARLRALYGNRVPAEAAAPMELRTELVAITRGPSPTARFGGSRTWALLAAAALLGAMLLGGALLAGSGLLRSIAIVRPTDSPSMATPVPSEGPHLMGGWPGPRAAPAGLYTWNPYRGPHWVHKVPDGSGSVELRFRFTTQPAELEALAKALASNVDGPRPEHPIEIPALAVQTWVDESGASAVNGVTVGPGAPGASMSKATQTWMMDIDGQAVAIDVTSYPDTTPALLAEAVTAIQSARPGRTPNGELRLVFELTRGWDSG